MFWKKSWILINRYDRVDLHGRIVRPSSRCTCCRPIPVFKSCSLMSEIVFFHIVTRRQISLVKFHCNNVHPTIQVAFYFKCASCVCSLFLYPNNDVCIIILHNRICLLNFYKKENNVIKIFLKIVLHTNGYHVKEN